MNAIYNPVGSGAGGAGDDGLTGDVDACVALSDYFFFQIIKQTNCIVFVLLTLVDDEEVEEAEEAADGTAPSARGRDDELLAAAAFCACERYIKTQK